MNQPWVYMCSPSWTPLPPHSPSHPFGSFQCTSPEHPVSCIKPGLEIRFTYDNIHVSMLFSQIIPPLPSPTESKRLFYTSVSPLLSRIFSCLVEAGASINGKQIDNICVSFAVSHIGSSLPSSIYSESIFSDSMIYKYFLPSVSCFLLRCLFTLLIMSLDA